MIPGRPSCSPGRQGQAPVPGDYLSGKEKAVMHMLLNTMNCRSNSVGVTTSLGGTAADRHIAD